MKRVVITGLGIVSSIGTSVDEVTRSLREGRSGLEFDQQMLDAGYRCCVNAPISELNTSAIPRRALRTMSTSATYAAVAAFEALADAGLSREALRNDRSGIIIGTAAGGINEVPRAEDTQEASVELSRLGAAGVIRIMNSGGSSNLAALLGVQGRVASVSSACSTGLYNVGFAFELIRYGEQDVCLAGSSEEMTWRQIGLSADNGKGMPTAYNDCPQNACRPFDRDRQGFVVSEGAGVVVLESLDHASQRGARVYAEIASYGTACDGADMFEPSGVGLRLALEQTMASAAELGIGPIDYINAHATGTVIGDRLEARVLGDLFGNGPMVSSTKGLTGHGQSAAGSQELVYTVLMMDRGFVAPTANLENIDPDCARLRHVQSLQEERIETAITTNNGLGGSNACLALRRL